MAKKCVYAVMLVGALLAAWPALAGPPYVTDDPEPTDTGHFENYFYLEGTHAVGAMGGPSAGIEINYGAFAETQLSLSLPLDPNPGPGGMGIVWAPLDGGIKYRFIDEDANGWRPEVAFFPQFSIPVGSASHTTPTTELLPLWMQKNFGPWAAFGGGGWTHNPGAGNRDFFNYGIALSYQIVPRLQLGAEMFGQSRSATTSDATTALGLGAILDFSETWHLIGSANRAVADIPNDRLSYNLAVKWTF
jgi:Putative MetA-pathway of phenol degradation